MILSRIYWAIYRFDKRWFWTLPELRDEVQHLDMERQRIREMNRSLAWRAAKVEHNRCKQHVVVAEIRRRGGV